MRVYRWISGIIMMVKEVRRVTMGNSGHQGILRYDHG